MEKKYFIASVSCGNDSMAMVQELVRRGYPLDEIVFYSNGMDFDCVTKVWEWVKATYEPMGIKCTTLTPDYEFEYKMFNILVKNKDGSGYHCGYSWCGGRCRWGTTDKIKIIDKYCESKNAMVYVGIASNEVNRTADKDYKIHPLKEWGMNEKDCLQLNRQNGVEWLEKTNMTESGYIDLYSILDRVSCWCCANKNQWELWNIWFYFRETYWRRLMNMQYKTDRPMKKFERTEYGNFGNVFDMGNVFESGYVPRHRTRKDNRGK